MAVCEIWDVKGRLDHPIDYAENPEKTANPKYTEADLQALVDVMEYATNKLYAIISDEEKKSLVSYLIKEIQIYPNGTSDRILKSIEFNFPIYRDGREIRKLLWENGNTVETVCLLGKRKPDTTVKLSVDMDDYYRIINGKDEE